MISIVSDVNGTLREGGVGEITVFCHKPLLCGGGAILDWERRREGRRKRWKWGSIGACRSVYGECGVIITTIIVIQMLKGYFAYRTSRRQGVLAESKSRNVREASVLYRRPSSR